MFENRFVRLFISGVITILLGLLLNYLFMPAWTFRSAGMWGFLLLMAFIWLCISAILDYFVDEDYFNTGIFGAICVIIVLVLIIGGLTSAEMFNAYNYHKMVSIPESNFAEDVPTVSDSTPIFIVDMATAQHLGDRTIGSIKNATWYEVSNEYNLIKYQGGYYRISALEYGGYFKYQKAKHSGIPGYVLVDVTNQEAQYVELEEPIQYSPSGHFSHLLNRHLRNSYPSYMFGKSFFEIDEEGTPYYITSVETPTIGLFGGKTVTSFILTNAVTGQNKEYFPEDLPEWVEHAYGIDYLMRITNYNQLYVNGWWNSLFGQTGVNQTSYQYKSNSFTGYNTTIDSNGDIVFYTGVTPANRSETNLGFILANPRTGIINYYVCAGAEESSAQRAAESLVQNMGYSATFPTILNVNGAETYFMLLKDKAGLVQRYALCNMQDYTKVVQAETLEEAVTLYNQKLLGTPPSASNEQTTKVGTISNLYQAEIEGYTYYYFTLEGSTGLYMSSIVNSNKQVLLSIGTKVSITYVASSEEGVYMVTKIQF